MALIGRRGFVAGALGLGAAKGYPAGSAIAAETVSGVVLPGGVQPLRGPAGRPPYALAPYDPSGAAIPDDALDAAEFASVDDWLTALEETGRAGKIRSGNYHIGQPSPRRLVTSIFGYGPTRPVFHGTAAAWLHVLGDGVTIQYCGFRGFHMPILWKSDWTYWRGIATRSWWNHDAFAGPSRGGSDLIAQSDVSGLRVLDCDFRDCGVALSMVTDRFRISDVHFARNVISGGYGAVWVASFRLGDIYCYQNRIFDMEQGALRGHHTGTIFKIGTNYRFHQFDPDQVNIRVDNNECRNVVGWHTEGKTNSAVFADVRSVRHVSINYNIITDMYNAVGHEECNAIYCKSVHAEMRGNLIENCGNDGGAEGRGSAGAHYTLKGSTATDNAPWPEIDGDDFEDSEGTGNSAAGWDQQLRDAVSIGGAVRTRPLLYLSNSETLIENLTVIDYNGVTDADDMHAILRSYHVNGLVMRNIRFSRCSANALYINKIETADGSLGRALLNWQVEDWRGTEKRPQRVPRIIFLEEETDGWVIRNLRWENGDSIPIMTKNS